MRLIRDIILVVSFISLIQGYTVSKNSTAKCLSDLTTKELSNSYNYLQLSSKFGTNKAYPGFSSLFIKLSDDDLSKSHELTKFLVLRKIELDRLVNVPGVRIRNKLTAIAEIRDSLTEARTQNEETWKLVQQCHQEAANINDANIQDYLESEFVDHHIKIDKLLSDIEQRIDHTDISEKDLIIYMIDEELLDTYGDRRKDIFS